jgi:cytochrome c-type biogenesis protein
MDLYIFLAFGAGLLSFLSPCCLPLYPAFLSYITGVSVEELQNENGFLKRKAMFHTFFFLVGFSLIFIALGFSTSVMGTFLLRYNDFIRQIVGLFIILFGLIVIGLYQPKFMMKNMKSPMKKRPHGYLGSIVIGMGFAAGWSPCTGPILASVIALGVSNPEAGVLYMMVYTLGFSIPFFIMSFFIGRLKWIKKYNRQIIKIGGYIMILMGVLLYFDWLSRVTTFLTNHFYKVFL